MKIIHHLLAHCFIAVLLIGNTALARQNLLAHDVVVSEHINVPWNDEGELIGFELSLNAMGTDIRLQLQPSRLNQVAALSDVSEFSRPYIYEGFIHGDVNSWARVTIKDGKPNGHLFYYGQLLQLDNRTHLRGLIDDTEEDSELVLIETASSADATRLLDGFNLQVDRESYAPVYKLSDNPAFHRADTFNPPVSEPLRLASEISQSDFGNANSSSKKHVARNATTRSAFGQSVTRALRIGIVVDSYFNETHQNRGLARALSIINSVDAIYQSQLGIAIIVEGIRVYDEPSSDPMRNTAGSVDQILGKFQLIRLGDSRLPNDLTLVHLFSGHRDPERVIGLGWIGTACRLDGFDVSMSTPFPFDALLAAHEIAHNLGALHDDNAQCLAETSTRTSTLMWPKLTSTSTADFSQCSKRNMQASVNASCNIDNIDVGVRVRTLPSSEILRRSVIIDVTNKDRLQRATELVSKTQFPDGTIISDLSAGCRISGTTVHCNHGTVRALTVNSLSMSATVPSRSQEIVQAEVELLNASDINTNDNRAVIQLLTFDESTGEAIAGVSVSMDDDYTNFQSNDTIGGIGSTSAASMITLLLMLIRSFGSSLRRKRSELIRTNHSLPSN